MAAMQLMWARGLRLVSWNFIEYSFTDLREDGQPSWLLSIVEWFRSLCDSNPRRFYPRGFVALRLNPRPQSHGTLAFSVKDSQFQNEAVSFDYLDVFLP